MVQPVHPFPARMAPGLALETLETLQPNSVVLDPMSGSGTVLRQANDLGHTAVGFDMDPLAVLMAQVWTTPVNDAVLLAQYEKLLSMTRSVASNTTTLSWLDGDTETAAFMEFWFAEKQRTDLTKFSYALKLLTDEAAGDEEKAAVDVLRLGLSRIIVTKEQAASLARDTSHSRPHRVSETSEYDVFHGFDKSLISLRRRLKDAPPKGGATVKLGDARRLPLEDDSVDAVITSPPYLNAIDYLRGHRLALVWLGWPLSKLRGIRSTSIGAERSPEPGSVGGQTGQLVDAMLGEQVLERRHLEMVRRYAVDVDQMIRQVARVLKPGGQATFVVGNSCLQGNFIKNADGVATAAASAGLLEVARSERDLPQQSRYLPVTGATLAKRMRTETVLKFAARAA